MEAEKSKAKERKAEHGGGGGRGQKQKTGSGNLPEPVKGRTRDAIGAAVGMSGKTYEAAKAKGRQAKAGPQSGRGKKQSASGNLPEPINGQSRDAIGAAVGMSGKTYEVAKRRDGRLKPGSITGADK